MKKVYNHVTKRCEESNGFAWGFALFVTWLLLFSLLYGKNSISNKI